MSYVSTEFLNGDDTPRDRPITAQELIDKATVLWEEGGYGNRCVADWFVLAAEALVAKGEPCDFRLFKRRTEKL
jgi:hypothetical protein